jgi:predicted ATPase
MPAHTAEQFARNRSSALSELPLLGRERELARLLDFVAARTPVLVHGSRGLGKTRLLLELNRRLSAAAIDAVYIRFSQPLHAFLLDIAGRLSLDHSGSSSVALRGVLWKAFESKPQVILLDDIAEATPPFYRFLERIVAAKGNAIVASVVHPHAAGALQRIFWNRQMTVPLRALNRQDAGALVECAIAAFSSDRPLSSEFALRVTQAARGNPGRIVDMCIRAADPAYRAGDDHIRFGALAMDSLTGWLP